MRKLTLPVPDDRAYEMVVVGASNAGLSAALVLGRACRRVLVLDGGPARNAPAASAHGFFTRDGAPPAELLRLGREQLRPYAVEICAGEVQQARRTETGFALALANGAVVRAGALVLATGIADELPAVPGVADLWGRGVYHCPYCHGWENRFRRVAVYGRGTAGYEHALLLRHWVPGLTLCTDGPAGLAPAQQAHLAQLAVSVIETPVTALEGSLKCLQALTFADGRRLALDALFLQPAQRQRSTLAAQLGCALAPDGLYVQVSEAGRTSVPDVYAVGDMTGPLQQALLAAAHGTRAAVALNHDWVARSYAAA